MSKYRAVKTEVDGHLFDSKREAERYRQLMLMLQNGDISHLVLQPKFPIIVEGMNVCSYIADFAYDDRSAGRRIVEDVKGFKTTVYRLKKKLVKACYGIDIVEV